MSTELLVKTCNIPVVADGLDRYVAAVNAIPLLTAEEETRLAEQFRVSGDLQAAQKLVLSHLRYVVKIARGFAGYGLCVADLIQEGTVGLMKAVKRFDPQQGVRLVTFAMHWIKAEIHEYVIKNWRIVKIATTKAQRKLFFNLRKAKQQLSWFTSEEVNMVAADLGVKPSEVREMEQRLYAHDAFIDAAPDEDESSHGQMLQLESTIPDPQSILISEGSAQQFDALENVLDQLDERSQTILRSRWLNQEKCSLKDLAEIYGISIERVRQLEKAALLKCRALLPQD